MFGLMEPSPTQKGNIAETAITAEAIRLGIDVLRPVVDGYRYDLVFDTGPKLLRIQCKWARLVDDVVRVCLRTNRTTPAGYVTTTYVAHEIDAFAAWCADLRTCYLLPIEEFAGRTHAYLRLSQAKNNQSLRVHWAASYELGAIAQLGERRAGSAKVAGSSPASSIAV